MPNLSRLPAPKNLIDPRRVAALTDIAKRRPSTTAQRAAEFFPRPPVTNPDLPAPDGGPARRYAPEVYDGVNSLVQDFMDSLSAILPLDEGVLSALKGRISTAVGDWLGNPLPAPAEGGWFTGPPPAPTPTNRNIIDRVPAGILARRKLVPGWATPGQRPVFPPDFIRPPSFPPYDALGGGLDYGNLGWNTGGGAFPNPRPPSGYVKTGGEAGMGVNPPYRY